MNFWHISNKTPNFVLMIELAQHIEVLLLENDCVIVPGFGGFVAYYTPAMRVEGNTFLPPTRTIGFNPQLKLNDGLLVQSYMAVYDTNFSDATKIVEEEVAELIAVLHKEGKVDLANVGELRYTIHGAYEFIPYENRITTPYLYGLDSFEMKEMAVLHKPEEKVLIPVAAQERTKPYEIRINRAVLRNAVAMIAAIALFFAFSTPIENTAVEKDNYARLLPIDLFEKIENRSVVMTPVEVKQETKKSVTTAKISHGATSSEKETGKRATKPLVVKEVKVVKPVAEKQMEDNYHIIVAGGITLKDAEIMAEQLKAKGFHRAKVLNSDGKVRVSIMSYATREEAMKQLLKIRENEAYKTAWMLAK